MFTKRSTFRSFVIVGLITAASVSLEAQGGPPRQGRPLPPTAQVRPGAPVARERMVERRTQMQERMQLMRGARGPYAVGGRRAVRGVQAAVVAGDRRAVRRTLMRRQMIRNEIRDLTPEQRVQFRANRQALQTERQRIGAQVRAGAITREQARTQIQAWRQQHLPDGLGLRARRGPGGDF